MRRKWNITGRGQRPMIGCAMPATTGGPNIPSVTAAHVGTLPAAYCFWQPAVATATSAARLIPPRQKAEDRSVSYWDWELAKR